MTKTYEIVSGPPAMPFETYASRVRTELANLLDSEPDEQSMQKFLEANPCLVPGLRSLGHSGAFVRNSIIVSQPALPGLSARVPDFMCVPYSSIAVYPTLVEIERPGKRLFTDRGVPSAPFTQARHQLTQWRAWFERPENKLKFVTEYGIANAPAGDIVDPRFLLVYGRRSEFERDPELTRQRGLLLDGSVEAMLSYDRLEPDHALRNAITVKAIGVGKFRVVAVPPTFKLGPTDCARLLGLEDIDGAIERSALISPERRAFLLERLRYWLTWAEESQQRRWTATSSGDEE